MSNMINNPSQSLPSYLVYAPLLLISETHQRSKMWVSVIKVMDPIAMISIFLIYKNRRKNNRCKSPYLSDNLVFS